jgi:hypothetical protein
MKPEPDIRNLPARALIAMVGLKPLPGSPDYEGSEAAVIERALEDVERYIAAGADAVLIENSGDVPYQKPPLEDKDLELVEHICASVRMRFRGPVGLQLLEAANESAMRIAASTGLDFIRAEGYVFAHIGGAGLIEGCAGKLLRLRARLKARHIRVFADVRKKHCSHALTGDLPLTEHVRQAEFFRADGVIVTGPRTGSEPEVSDLESVAFVSQLPRLIGSGMTADNIERFFRHADGFIVGSTFRRNGAFLGELDADRLDRFMDVFRRLKSSDPAE